MKFVLEEKSKEYMVLKSAISRELVITNAQESKYMKEIEKYERKYKMDSKEFLKKFDAGELGDNEDFFHWAVAIDALKHWADKKRASETILESLSTDIASESPETHAY